MNHSELTTVTYNFADGTKVVQPINKECFLDEKGRRKSINQVMDVFKDTMFDKGAISFSVEGDNEEVKLVKELHFTPNERKVAKRDYKEFRKRNPAGFFKARNGFISEIVDKFNKVDLSKLRFNLKGISQLSY